MERSKDTGKIIDRSKGAKVTPHIVSILTKIVQEFLAQLDYTKMAQEAVLAEMKIRKLQLRKAFSIYCASQLGKEPNVTIDNPLKHYVYITDVFRDAYEFMFEYLGEVEHEFGLDFTKKNHPYHTDEEMWREDFYLTFHEYMA